jgi:ketosteroid isomerase-like protein
MASYPLEEVESAFRTYWTTGAVGEDWDAWADLFTEDALYVEHVLGNRNGREEIRAWIKPIMAQYGEIYTAYEWHLASGSGRVVVYMQNRRDNPSGDGVLDFPGVTILQYAGGGKWSLEEDYWAVPAATQMTEQYETLRKQHDRGHRDKRTRRNWGNGPAWTRGAATYWDAHPKAAE